MLAVHSDIAIYHCLYTQGAVDLQTPGFFDSPGSKRRFRDPETYP